MTILRWRIRPVMRVALSFAAVVLLASFLVLGGPPRSALAEPEASAEYQGSMSDGGSVLLVVSADRTTVDVSFSFRNRQYGCPYEAFFTQLPIATGGAVFRADSQPNTIIVAANPTVTQIVSVVGYWDIPTFSAASGVLMVDPAAGQACPARRLSCLLYTSPSPRDS